MEDLFLSEPDNRFQHSFENYVLAYKETTEEQYFNKYKKAIDNFQDYLTDLLKYSEGIDLPQGWVRTSTFWLIVRNDVVGVVRVRHQNIDSGGHIGYDISPDFRNRGYGFQILKLALEKAMKIGLEEVIVTCNIDNTASKKIIEKNNGKLLGTIFDEEDDEYLYKYRINIKHIAQDFQH